MKTLSTALRLSVLACACASVCAVQAQSVPELKEVVITASRTLTRSDELVSDVVVVTRAQIEQSTARTLPEVLARSAGVQFSSNGGLGKSANVYIRGAEARHTILLIDGVRFGSATAGTPSWENIPLEMIERIEVLKGPASALYGSDGVGGVVQIFTRTGAAGFFPSASLTLGSNAYSQLSAGLSGGAENLSYALSAQRTRDTGFSATNSKVPFGSFNPDDDGFRQNAFNASLRYRFAPGWSVDTKLMQVNGKNQFDDGPGAVDTRGSLGTSLVSLGLEGKVSTGWTTRLSFAESQDKSTQLASASTFTTVPSNFDTKQSQWSWKNDVQTPAGLVVLGLEHLKQSLDSTTKYTVSTRSVNSVFGGINGSRGVHSWQANVRSDRNSQFGGNTTGFVGYGLALSPQWRVNVSHGTSFVAPSFNQLYFPGFGNANLQPEKGRNTDLGLTYSNAGHTIKLSRFDNKIRGFISPTTPSNVPQARIDGWTLGYDGQFGPWTLRASYDDLNPRNELTGKILPRRNRTQTNAGIAYSAAAWKLGGQLTKAGSRFDNVTNTVELDGYTTLDLNAEYALSKNWTVQGKVNNATNREYQTILGYNQPGRGAFVTLRYQPK
jgi:vitamin B12 transporter